MSETVLPKKKQQQSARMHRIRSHADIIVDLESLATAAQDNAASLPSTEPHRLALEQALADVKTGKFQLNEHIAGKQKATQDFGSFIRHAQEMAARLRGAVKADLGPRNEQLINYGIAPIRKHARKAQSVAPPTATPTPEPGTTTTPTPAPKPSV